MTKPAVILYVIGSLQTGGTERHLIQVLPRLDRQRWRPVVYCNGCRGEGAGQLEAQGVRVIGPPIASSPRWRFFPLRIVRLALAWLKLLALMLWRPPSIAHFVLPAAYVFGAPAAILARVPIKVMSRRSLSLYQKRQPMLRPLERRLHGRMNAILANSRSVLEDISKEPGVRSDRLVLLYNGINLVPFETKRPRAEIRGALGIHAEAFVIAIVANLIPYKAHDLLLQSLGMIRSELPADWRLIVIGRDDGAGSALRLLAEQQMVGDNVHWLGERPDVPDLLSAADVGVLCSHEEGFANAILEGMAAGLPMVVTDVGGNAEAVVNGETGFVVPPADPAALGAAILRLARDPALAQAMGKRADERVRKHFSLERCVANYDALYDALIRGELKTFGTRDTLHAISQPAASRHYQPPTAP